VHLKKSDEKGDQEDKDTRADGTFEDLRAVGIGVRGRGGVCTHVRVSHGVVWGCVVH
jgi:hypothetical protein